MYNDNNIIFKIWNVNKIKKIYALWRIYEIINK
jgi:hypothetical protein